MKKIKDNCYGILFLGLIGLMCFLILNDVGGQCLNSSTEIISVQDRISVKQCRGVQEEGVQEDVVQKEGVQEDAESARVGQEEVKKSEVSQVLVGSKIKPVQEVEEIEGDVVFEDLSYMPWYLKDNYLREKEKERSWAKYLALDDKTKKKYDIIWTRDVYEKGGVISQTSLPSWYQGWMWNKYCCRVK